MARGEIQIVEPLRDGDDARIWLSGFTPTLALDDALDLASRLASAVKEAKEK